MSPRQALILACAVGALMFVLSPSPTAAANIVAADDVTVVAPGAGAVEVYLTRTGGDAGNPLEVSNFQVGVLLTGPDAGTHVTLTDGVDTIDHVQAGAAHLQSSQITNGVQVYRPTLNLGAPFDIPDDGGLLRVLFEVSAEATLGEYQLSILEISDDSAQGTMLLEPDGVTQIPFTPDSATIHVVPEPGSAGLLGLATVLLLGRGRASRRRNGLAQAA